MQLVKAIGYILVLMPFLSHAETQVCESCPVSSITEAVAQAQPHDTLVVQKGTYYENDILVDKPLTIIGIDFPVIDGKEQGEIFTIVSDSVPWTVCLSLM